ncbi:MAG: putative phosphoglycerate mutase [Modestobacter sp.]|jgi:broad specificity phosphatase PhoE|nr:putative phosphoglycerate mutase [Modestobacter sp.]
MAQVPGPSALWLVRHGESQGNLADARAHASGAARLELDVRDPDVPLSATGEEQADALGRWLAALPAAQQPTTVLSSPFARAAVTAERVVAASGLDLTIRYDERLRERDFGAFDGMTREGIRGEYPDEARRRDLLGKFYYRPPGGESWADVALRVRSLLATEALRHDGERLVCVSHQAVIMVFRYVVEELAESQLLEIDRTEQVANTSLTRYERGDDGLWQLTDFNGVAHLGSAEHAPVTEENDVPSPA